MATYTLVTALSRGGVEILLASPPDGDVQTIEKAIAEFREDERRASNEQEEGFRWEVCDTADISIQPGCELTNEEPEDEDRILWSGSEGGWLMDENGQTFEYAVRTP